MIYFNGTIKDTTGYKEFMELPEKTRKLLASDYFEDIIIGMALVTKYENKIATFVYYKNDTIDFVYDKKAIKDYLNWRPL